MKSCIVPQDKLFPRAWVGAAQLLLADVAFVEFAESRRRRGAASGSGRLLRLLRLLGRRGRGRRRVLPCL